MKLPTYLPNLEQEYSKQQVNLIVTNLMPKDFKTQRNAKSFSLDIWMVLKYFQNKKIKKIKNIKKTTDFTDILVIKEVTEIEK